jgi:diguanylate cyclase (GGDEF)-like protein
LLRAADTWKVSLPKSRIAENETDTHHLQDEEYQQARRVLESIEALEGRDRQLWSIGVLIMLVLVSGFFALVLPNFTRELERVHVEKLYVPQLLLGLVVLIILFNIYVLDQRRALRSSRAELVRQLVRSEAAEKLSLIDPLTGLFNRRYLDQILPKEVSRAKRLSTSLTFAMVDVDDFKSVNNRFGHVEGDWVLREISRLLMENFRASDSIIRFGGDEFLVVMMGTSEDRAQIALDRLLAALAKWNTENASRGYSLSFSCGMSSFSEDSKVMDVVALADQRMYEHKARKSSPANP